MSGAAPSTRKAVEGNARNNDGGRRIGIRHPCETRFDYRNNENPNGCQLRGRVHLTVVPWVGRLERAADGLGEGHEREGFLEEAGRAAVGESRGGCVAAGP